MTNLNNHEKIRINCRKTIYDVELTVASTIVLIRVGSFNNSVFRSLGHRSHFRAYSNSNKPEEKQIDAFFIASDSQTLFQLYF